MSRILVFVFALLGIAGCSLPPLERPSKILMLAGLSPKSHRNVFIALANALAERGHEVSMLTGFPLDGVKFKVYKHDMYEHPSLQEFQFDNLNVFEYYDKEDQFFNVSLVAFKLYAQLFFDEDKVQELYRRRDEFDLFFIDGLANESQYPFIVNKIYITINTEGLSSRNSAKTGNLLNPAYFPSMMNAFPHPFSFSQRLKNIFFSIFEAIMWDRSFSDPQHRMLEPKFPDMPPFSEIENNHSLSLLNSHFSFTNIAPILPNQVEIGCMHCKPGKPLPKDLAKFISGNTPVVYMSLGSIARSGSIPPEYKKIILDTFSKLPYKFVWKYEDDTLGKLPDNILVKSWMPQQDILAHPNVKVFISHCGLLGSQEAMYHATPILGMPLFADQPKNILRWENQGIGKAVHWRDLTEELLAGTIQELIDTPSYHVKISAISSVFRDQMETPVDRAVYWTEYVIRHKGARHLRSPELDLSWIELLHLDIIFLMHLTAFLVVKLLKKMFNMFRKNDKNVKIKTN